jgi:hypothetical protein
MKLRFRFCLLSASAVLVSAAAMLVLGTRGSAITLGDLAVGAVAVEIFRETVRL